MHRALLAAYAVYLLAAAYMVFWPQPDTPAGTVSHLADAMATVGLGFISGTMIEFVLNVILFVPMTLLGVLTWPRVNPIQWVLLGVAATGFIEVLQFLVLPDRSATLSDLIANTLGAVIGVDLGLRLRWLLERRTSTATTDR